MSFEIRPLPGVIGAEVHGFDIARDGADEEARRRLQEAWTDRVMLVFRDMAMDEAGFMQLAGLFGENVPQPVQRPEYRVEGFPLIRLLSNRHRDTLGDNKPLNVGGTWHTDHSHLPDPPRGTVLRALRLPGKGGDTSFTNQRAAYEALDDAARREVDPLVGHHVYNSRYAPRRMATMTPDEEREAPSAHHPLVRPHPASGRKALYFNPIRIELCDVARVHLQILVIGLRGLADVRQAEVVFALQGPHHVRSQHPRCAQYQYVHGNPPTARHGAPRRHSMPAFPPPQEERPVPQRWLPFFRL